MNQPLDNSNLLSVIDGLTLAIVAMLMALGHVFPWHLLPMLCEWRGERLLRRPIAYLYGVGWIWAACGAYALIRSAIGQPSGIPFWYVTCVISAAGLGTLLPRAVKTVLNDFVNRQTNGH